MLVEGPLEVFCTSKTNGKCLHGPVRGPNRTLNKINLINKYLGLLFVPIVLARLINLNNLLGYHVKSLNNGSFTSLTFYN